MGTETLASIRNHAVKVLDDCRSALEDVGVAVDSLRDKMLRTAFMRVENLVKRLGTNPNNHFLNTLNEAISSSEILMALPNFANLDGVRFSGISASTRMRDFRNGLQVLAEYTQEDTLPLFKNSNENESSVDEELLTERSIFARSVNKMLSDAHHAFRQAPYDIKTRPTVRDFGYQIDRTVDISDQLLVAGEQTFDDVFYSLMDALINLTSTFESFLSSEDMTPIASLIKSASDYTQGMMARRIEVHEIDILSTPPEQTLAPFQFKISGERLTLQPQDANPKDGASAITDAAIRALTGLAEDVDEDLAKSNHPRLFRAFTRLRDALTEGASVVEIGMLCASFEGQVNATAEELSDALLALLNSFTKGVTNYAAQFEEWQSFSDNAAEANFTAQDAEAYSQVARVLANELERREEVDDRVPEALRQVADWNDRASTPKSRLSVGRTVLNMIAVCYSEVVTKPVKVAVKTMGTTIAVGIGAAAGAAVVAIVLNQASTHLAELAKPPEAAWLRPASRIIDAHLRKLDNP